MAKHKLCYRTYLIHPIMSVAERGIRGDSHMLMPDRKNQQIADIVLEWIDERATLPS